MRKIIKINKSLEKSNRNHLVLVDVQVQGRTGAYQSKRWKNPNSAFNYVERDLRRRGIDLNTAQFIDKKTKKQATQQEILKEYHKTGSNNTLQEFIGNKYTIKINKNEGNKDGYRLKDESVIDNNVADKSSLNTEVKNEPFKMGSTNFHIDDLTDIKRASIEYFMRKEEETAEKNKEEFNDLVNKMKSNNDPDLWEKYIFENTKSHRPIATMFDGNYPFERKAVEYHDESLLRYLQGRGIKNPEIISLREPKRPATDKEIKKWYSYYDGKKSLDQLLTEDFYVRDNKNNINYYGFRKDRARIRLSDDIEYGSFYDTSSTLGKLKNKYEEVLAESPISEFSSSAEKTKYELPIRRKIVEAIEQARQENIMISGEDLLVRAEEILKGKITEKKVKSMVYINQSTPSGVIKVMEEGDTFKVQTPFNEEFVRGLRELEGRRWDSENKVWNIPNKHKDELFMLLENNYNVKPKEEPESDLDNYTLEPKQIYNDNNIELTLVKDELEIKTPYNRTFTNYIRNKGGIWSADKKAWRINNTLKDEVIEDIKKIYNAPMGGETVKVEVDLFGLENDWNVHDSDEYSIKLGDFEVATRSDRDSEVKTGMGVTIYDKDSFPPRGGSRQNPTVSVREGVKATIELNKEIFDNLTDGELKYVKALEEPIYKESIITDEIIENMDSLLKPLLYGSGPRGGAQKRMAEARAFDAYDKVTENIEKKSDTDKKRELELKMSDFYNALSNGAITISQAMNNPNFKECAYLFILALLEDDEAEGEMNSLIDNLTFGDLLKSRNRPHLVPIETTIHRKNGTHRGIRWTNPRKGMEDLRNKISNQLKQPLQDGDEITFKRGDYSFNEEEFKDFFLENREEFGKNTTIDEVARGFEIHISRAEKRQLSMFGEVENEKIKPGKEDTPEESQEEIQEDFFPENYNPNISGATRVKHKPGAYKIANDKKEYLNSLSTMKDGDFNQFTRAALDMVGYNGDLFTKPDIGAGGTVGYLAMGPFGSYVWVSNLRENKYRQKTAIHEAMHTQITGAGRLVNIRQEEVFVESIARHSIKEMYGDKEYTRTSYPEHFVQVLPLLKNKADLIGKEGLKEALQGKDKVTKLGELFMDEAFKPTGLFEKIDGEIGKLEVHPTYYDRHIPVEETQRANYLEEKEESLLNKNPHLEKKETDLDEFFDALNSGAITIAEALSGGGLYKEMALLLMFEILEEDELLELLEDEMIHLPF